MLYEVAIAHKSDGVKYNLSFLYLHQIRHQPTYPGVANKRAKTENKGKIGSSIEYFVWASLIGLI